MKVDIDALITPAIWGLTDTAPTLEIYANQPFKSSDNQSVLVGSVLMGDFRRRVVGAVAGGQATFPAIVDIDSTEDSLTNQLATYSAYIRVQGRDPIPYLENFPLAPLPTGKTSWSWTEVEIHATNLVARRSYEVYTKQQTEALIALAVADVGLDLGWYNAKDNGLAGDGVTDDTVAFQALLDTIAAAGKDATVFFPNGEYLIGGALQDVALSNAQIVLPKIDSPDNMLALRLLGETPPAQAWATNRGVIIRSTLVAGNGSMIGVRHDRGFPGGNENNIAHNGCSWLSLTLRDLNFRCIANPTISALDLRFLPNVRIEGSVRVDVVGIDAREGDGAGGAEGSGPVPDLRCTEPTTATSYGIKLPIDYNPNLVMIDNLEVLGYYNLIRGGELISADNITLGLGKVGFEVFGGQHPSNIKKLLIVSTALPIKAGGADPVFAPGGSPTAIINIQQLDIENSSGLMAWTLTNLHVDDPNNYLHGDITWFQGLIPQQGLLRNGAGNLNFHNVTRGYHARSPFTELTGVAGQFQDAGSDHAVDETCRGLPTADNSRIAWKVMTTIQSGLNHLVGIVAFVNGALAANVDKRLAQIAGRTDGATNHGALEFYTMNNGVFPALPHAWLDRLGNFNLTKLMPRGEGPVLASGAAIAPTFPVHVVSGVAAITDITVPNIPAGAAVTIALIPSGAWTWTNAGNIGGPGGAAVVGRTLFITWVPSLNKWATSYV